MIPLTFTNVIFMVPLTNHKGSCPATSEERVAYKTDIIKLTSRRRRSKHYSLYRAHYPSNN